MAENNTGFFSKVRQAAEGFLDQYIEKAQTNSNTEGAWSRKGLLHVDYATDQQAGWIEKRGLVSSGVLKNMARKDSAVIAVILTRLSQVSAFAQPQKDRYSPGFKIQPKVPLEMSREDKIKLADPNLSDEERAQIKYEALKRISEEQAKQEEDMDRMKDFILHCGMPKSEMETDKKRVDFDKFVKLITMDTLTYNFSAIEKIPQKGHQKHDDWKLHSFYPVSAGTVKHLSKKSAMFYEQYLRKKAEERGDEFMKTPDEPYCYGQVVQGRVVAAWTHSEMAFEPRIPSVDPEDNGYPPGELELLIQLVTAHLYAEAHNRNFFTQGLGTKGLLHIKGESISQAQLEGFKRQWYSQVINSKNAFRPPIIGLADDVKWVQLAGNNKDMEFDNWMHYLIRMLCAIYQIDPGEINFDISKVNSSTLNETSNEQRIKQSRDKGLKPLLDYIENIINRHILQAWDSDLAEKYEFKFVGLDAETREQEAKRLKEEVETWKTYNEARIEMGKEPIEDGDVIGAAVFTQYKQMMEQAEMGGMDGQGGEGGPNEQAPEHTEEMDTEHDDILSDLESELEGMEKEAKVEADRKKTMEEKQKKEETTKKAFPVKVEYYQLEDDNDD